MAAFIHMETKTRLTNAGTGLDNRAYANKRVGECDMAMDKATRPNNHAAAYGYMLRNKGIIPNFSHRPNNRKSPNVAATANARRGVNLCKGGNAFIL
jgi:hypothetical protein